MSYEVKYEATFDRIDKTGATVEYMLRIYQKDYGGSLIPVTCGGVPVIQSYQTDDPKAPIKGSSLSVSLINQNGSLPLESFFSTNDDDFQVRLLWGPTNELLWEGFLVQDDCSETLVDYTHEINLSANDNLGLLKDVPLDKAKITYTFIVGVNDVWSTTAPHTLSLPAGISAFIQNGDLIQIHHPIFDVTYTITDASNPPDFTVAETTTGTGIPTAASDIDVLRPDLFGDKIPLKKVLDSCLAATGLFLETHIFCNFSEVSVDPAISFIEQTLVDPQTFLKDDILYDDCYSILEKVMKRFNCTLFQAKGVWNIVHWNELLYSGYPIPGFSYDSDFNLLDTIKLNHESIIFAGFNKFQLGPGEDTATETGLLHKLFRPMQFDKETFNYKPPARLLRNFDLQELGQLLNTSTTGSGITLQTTREYAVPWWTHDIYIVYGAPPYVWFIRVIEDFLGNEIERYLVLANNQTLLDSYRIEATKGDIFNISLSERTTASTATGDISMFIRLDTGAGLLYLTPTGWQAQALYENTFTGDTNEWNSFTTDSFRYPVPADGILTFILFPEQDGFLNVTTGETQIKDIRLDYHYFINQSTKIVGQTHKSEQLGTIKQVQDDEVFLDDSPRNALAGTLFLPTLSGLIQERTSRWNMAGRTNLRLGDLTTFETLFWRRIVRSILEGTFYGLVSADTLGDHVSMLSVFQYPFLSGLNFVAGTMEIDYRNNKFSGTLWEICTDTESIGDLTSTYEFKYLYSTK